LKNTDEMFFKIAVSNLKEKKYDEAEKLFLNLIKDHPKNINILRNLAITYFQNLKFNDAENILRKILTLNIVNKETVEFLILCLKKQDKGTEIVSIIKKYSEIIDPKYSLLSKYHRSRIPENSNEIENIRNNTLSEIKKSILNEENFLKVDENLLDPPIFNYSYDNKDNLILAKNFYELFNKSYPELRQDVKIKKNTNKDKIKIGFVSKYFKDHTINKLFKGIIFKINEKLFDIKVFYLNSIDQEYIENEITKKNLQTINLPKTFKEKVEVILKEKLDIIFYPDIGMSAELYYLTFLKLANKQMTCWGHPETTGNPKIDYFLSSSLLETNKFDPQKHYSEKLLLSNFLPMYFYKPKIQKISDDQISENNLYSCPQTLFKIHPDFDKVIISILKEDKRAQIYLINDKEEILSEKIYQRIKKRDSQHIDRINFLNKMTKENYIHHCGRSSVLLDPFYFGAGNSFHESMVYGTQTVSMPTEYLKSRIVLGAYKQMQIESPPITKNVDNYLNTAIELANMPKKTILERKKYYADSADKYLFENYDSIKSIEKILNNIVRAS